ncbi:ribonuclease J [Patescibacteria group bacterium]|nr:ribonuclease J [Patescibacteria group bacterium]
MDQSIKYLSLGGIGNVTRNMSVYEYGDEILLVDCGLGFADETMLGVDLLLPDISYLQKSQKKIVGMVISHGHEDHIGALPFILPQLPAFPIYATPLTAALANGKLNEFQVLARVKPVDFNGGEINLGKFSVNFIRVTHSVPDTSNLFIKTPVGNFFHASDFKFDLTPYDKQKPQFDKIAKAAESGIMCLLSDSLGAEKKGHTPSEQVLSEHIERVMSETEGKFFITTFSSNISRLNQAADAAKKMGRKICFVGRSLINATAIAKDLGYMKIDKSLEISVRDIKNYKDRDLCIVIAGSQAQEGSGLSRAANDDFREIKIGPRDVVVFSSDPIPGNENSINALIDTISRKGARVVYSEISDNFHVSGHGSQQDLLLMMSLVKPKKLLPIGGTYRHMVAYRNLAKTAGFKEEDVLMVENGQELIFSGEEVRLGKKHIARNIYVDEISGEEVESFVLRDREKIAKEGVVIVMAEIDSQNGQLIEKPIVIVRGMGSQDSDTIDKRMPQELRDVLARRGGKVTNWIYIRKTIGDATERFIFKTLRKRPLVLPVVVEV